MMTPEEARVLAFLRQHLTATVAELASACLSGATPDWVDRVIANLDWFGYVTVYQGQGTATAVVQITDEGLKHAGH